MRNRNHMVSVCPAAWSGLLSRRTAVKLPDNPSEVVDAVLVQLDSYLRFQPGMNR
jgi:hypothetical protein